MAETNDDALNLNRLTRPNNLRDYVADGLTRSTIKRIVSEQRQRFLIISGGSGLGKTTLARIIAKEYRCNKKGGKTCYQRGTKPDERCESCKNFDFYIKTGNLDSLPNITEVDVGHYRTVSDIEDLLREIKLKSVGDFGSLNVLILDEVQSLSRTAQESLLKQLEEPETDTLTIMCTTAIDRILDTVVNRAETVINLQPPSIVDLAHHLETVCKQTSIPYSKLGLTLIASRCNDKIRNAVQVLDNISGGVDKNTIDEEAVEEYFASGNVPTSYYFDFIEGMLNPDDKMKAMNVLYEVKNRSDFETFASELINFVRRGVYIRNGINAVGVLDSEYKAYKDLVNKISVRQFAILLDYLKKIKYGDIELNLITLVYSTLDDIGAIGSGDRGTSILPSPKEKAHETSYRGNKVDKIDKTKKSIAIDAISKLDEKVSSNDLLKKLL